MYPNEQQEFGQGGLHKDSSEDKSDGQPTVQNPPPVGFAPLDPNSRQGMNSPDERTNTQPQGGESYARQSDYQQVYYQNPGPPAYQQTHYAYFQPFYAQPDSPVNIEKKAIRRSGNFIGLSLLMLELLSIVLVAGISIVFIIVSGDVNAYGEFILSPIGLTILQIVLSVLMFTIPFILIAALTKNKIGDLVPMGRVKPALMAALVLMVLACFMLGNTATSLFSQTLGLFGIEPTSPEFEAPAGVYGMILYIIAVCIIPALLEEFAMRGIIMGILRGHGTIFAIFISAVLFGLIHGNLVQAPFAFIGGLGLGFALVISNSIWPCIIAHFLNNFLSVSMEYISGLYGMELANTVYYICFLVILLLGILATVYILKKQPRAFQPAEPPTALSGRQKTGAFFSSPMIIISVVVFGLLMLTSLNFNF